MQEVNLFLKLTKILILIKFKLMKYFNLLVNKVRIKNKYLLIDEIVQKDF